MGTRVSSGRHNYRKSACHNIRSGIGSLFTSGVNFNLVMYNMSLECHDMFRIISLPALVRLFKDRTEMTGKRKYIHDFCYAFFWSFIVYNKQYVRNIPEAVILEGPKQSPVVCLIQRDTHLIISIRGTVKRADVMTNLAIFKGVDKKIHNAVLNKLGRIPNPDPGELLQKLESCKSSLHAGMFNHTYKCLEMILDYLPFNAKDKPIYLHGHSLGAACSVILHFFLIQLGFTNVYCTCIGCPPVFAASSIILRNLDAKKDAFKHYFTEGDKIVNSKTITTFSTLTFANSVYPTTSTEILPPVHSVIQQNASQINIIRVLHTNFVVPSDILAEVLKDTTNEFIFTEYETDIIKICTKPTIVKNENDYKVETVKGGGIYVMHKGKFVKKRIHKQAKDYVIKNRGSDAKLFKDSDVYIRRKNVATLLSQ